jgi:hypothetical protein
MLLSRPFAHRRATLLGLAGALVLCTFLALPEGQAFAAKLLVFFRGETIKAVSTDMAHIRNAYDTLYELDEIGTLDGKVPTSLTSVSSVAQAATLSKLTLVQPNVLPDGLDKTPRARAVAPTTVSLTLQKPKADRYFQSVGSSLRMPEKLNNTQLIVNFPGVAVLEYSGAKGGKLFLGQADQVLINLSDNSSSSLDEVRSFLLGMPGLSADTVKALQDITDWTSTIPLAVPTDKAAWSSTSVGGQFGGKGIIVNDNSGIGSALLWQTNNGKSSLGIAGYGLKASELQSIAGSLK